MRIAPLADVKARLSSCMSANLRLIAPVANTRNGKAVVVLMNTR